MKGLGFKTQKAQKPHKCDWCGLVINIGIIYERQGVLSDGNMFTWKNHVHCSELATKLKMYDECDEGLSAEDFRENVLEAYRDIMRHKYLEIYESEGFEYPYWRDLLSFVMLENKIKS